MNEETRKDLLTIAAFILQRTKTEGDNQAVAGFKAEVANFDFEKPVTQSEAVGSSFDILRDFAKLSQNTQADDRAVATAEIVFRSLVPISAGTNDTGTNLIDQLRNLFRRRRNR